MVTERGAYSSGKSFIGLLYGDMIRYSNAVDDFGNGKLLKPWQKAYLETYDCNSLNSPNIYGWEALTQGRQTNYSAIQSPYSHMHVQLITHTRDLYDRLHWEQTRLLLGGEEGLKVVDPQSPITSDELPLYISQAQEQGLFHLKTIPTEAIRLIPDLTGIIVAFAGCGFVPGKLIEKGTEVAWDPRFRGKLMTAGIHKLGCFLAVMDHAVFEAQKQGKPIAKDYKPNDPVGEFGEYYQDKYGRQIPNIAQMYREAHTVFVSLLPSSIGSPASYLIHQTTTSFA